MSQTDVDQVAEGVSKLGTSPSGSDLASLAQSASASGSEWQLKDHYPIDEDYVQKCLNLETDDSIEWTTAYESSEVVMQRRNTEGSHIWTIKADAKLPGIPAQLVVDCLFDMDLRVSWDTYLKEAKLVESLNEDQDVVYYAFKSPPLVSDRDLLQARWRKKDFPEKGSTTIVYRSTVHPLMPVKAGRVRGHTELSIQIVRPVEGDPDSCTVALVTRNDIKGTIPKWVINMLSARAPVEFFSSLRGTCEALLEDPDKYRAGIEKRKAAREERVEEFESRFGLPKHEHPKLMGYYSCSVAGTKGHLYVSMNYAAFGALDADHTETFHLSAVGDLQKRTQSWVFQTAMEVQVENRKPGGGSGARKVLFENFTARDEAFTLLSGLVDHAREVHRAQSEPVLAHDKLEGVPGEKQKSEEI